MLRFGMRSAHPASVLLSTLGATLRSAPDGLGRTARDRIDPEWIEQAIASGGSIELRRRKMPARVVVWLVIGICLFAGMSFPDVVRRFGLTLPTKRGRAQLDPTSGSIAEARKRLGGEAMKRLFEITSEHWRRLPEFEPLTFKGLQVCAIDGVNFRVPDTPSNREQFGRPPNVDAGYPATMGVCVIDVITHLIIAATFGSSRDGEVTHLRRLVSDLPGKAVYLLDRNFNSFADLYDVQDADMDRHWLVRAKRHMRVHLVRELGPGDALVEARAHSRLRRRVPDLPRSFVVRRLEFSKNNKTYVVLTSLLDPVRFPAADVAALYTSRWEIELVFDDIKTEQRERVVALRSKSPDMVYQEIFGLLVAHNLVRIEMAHAATLLGVAPTRISFHRALAVVEREFGFFAGDPPTKLWERHDALYEKLKYLVLPPRRKRSYPRAVKQRPAKYHKKAEENCASS
jgi:hypothetical protein